MRTYRYFTLCILMCVTLAASALDIRVASFSKSEVEIDYDDIVLDEDGNDASLINVYFDWDNVEFKGEIIQSEVTKKSEGDTTTADYRVYMGHHPQFLMVQAPGIGLQTIDFDEFGFEELEPGEVYDLHLEAINGKERQTPGNLLNMMIISDCPAKVTISSRTNTLTPAVNNNTVSVYLKRGLYNFTVTTEHGKTVRGTTLIRPSRPRNLTVKIDCGISNPDTKEDNNTIIDLEDTELSNSSVDSEDTELSNSSVDSEDTEIYNSSVNAQIETKKGVSKNTVNWYCAYSSFPDTPAYEGNTGKWWYLKGVEFLKRRNKASDVHATTCFIMSAYTGYVPGKYECAVSLFHNRGFRNEENGKLCLRLLAPEDSVLQSQKLYFKLFNDAAHAGLPEAMNYLVSCYSLGFGTAINLREAQRWAYKGAQLYYVPCAVDAGYYYDGNPNPAKVTKNRTLGWECTKFAANRGNVIAIHNLAVTFQNGLPELNIISDYETARRYYHKASCLDDPASMHMLAEYMRGGYGGLLDPKRAKVYIVRSLSTFLSRMSETIYRPWENRDNNEAFHCFIDSFHQTILWTKEKYPDVYETYMKEFCKSYIGHYLATINDKGCRLYMNQKYYYNFINTLRIHNRNAAARVSQNFKGFIKY